MRALSGQKVERDSAEVSLVLMSQV
jgi:hypothetical protein